MTTRALCMCVLSLCVMVLAGPQSMAEEERPQPKATDERLVVELFAEHPQVVTPTGLDVDARGRVFVAESHTHFPPDDYDGPKHDRILVLEDTDEDGRADKRTIFHAGFTHIMDIAIHDDGSLFVATRMDVHRLRDTSGDDHADDVDAIVRLDTTGTYPHNGLSGLAFDFSGNLHFGLGENIGHDYTLIGTDGKQLGGGGEGGSTYRIDAGGGNLHRTSTGWWNPFGLCVDAFGRVFGTDNDPDSSPPCRLIQIVDGGDYGYEYRYGRTGLHPLVTWTGSILGTLPMVAGTGEAPCSVVAYESDQLPEEYRGQLFVASWADHRIENYQLRQDANHGLTTTTRQVLVHSRGDFRPVDLAIAPDGSVYFSDWVSSSYKLHKQGRVWRIRSWSTSPTATVHPRPSNPEAALTTADRKTRERAARALALSEEGRKLLRKTLRSHPSARARAAALQALAAVSDEQTDYAAAAKGDANLALRVLALRAGLRLQVDNDVLDWDDWSNIPVPLRAEAMRLSKKPPRNVIDDAIATHDPLLFHAAITALSRLSIDSLQGLEDGSPRQIVAALLAIKRNPQLRSAFRRERLGPFLTADQDPRVRFAAVKWIADERLADFRQQLLAIFRDEQLDAHLFLAVSAAIDSLDDKKPTDQPSSAMLLEQILEASAPAPIRRLALRLIDPAHPGLAAKISPLLAESLTESLTESSGDNLQLEVVRTLASAPTPLRDDTLTRVARDKRRSDEVRAAAIAGLAGDARHQDLLADMAQNRSKVIRGEALRSLFGVDLSESHRRSLTSLASRDAMTGEAVRRLLDGSPGARPPAEDLAAWEELIEEGSGDPAAGERVFFARRIGMCSRCHMVNGRGTAVGPDLSQISRRLMAERAGGLRWLLETILQPSLTMAPQYTPWLIVTRDGKQQIGLPRRKGGSSEAYLGSDGQEFVVQNDQILLHAESPESLMPQGLLNVLTRQELRDLFAFLMQGSEI